MILIADSGGSNTMWALLQGEKVIYLSSAGMHPFVLSDNLVCPLQLQENQNNITDLYFYGTGCAKAQEAEKVKHFLLGWFPGANVHVYSDLMAVAHGVWRSTPGNVAVLGTGSSMAYFDGNSLSFEVDSPGKEKDPGSGTHLGAQLFGLYQSGNLPADILSDLQKIKAQSIAEENVQQLFTRYLMRNLNNQFLADICRQAFFKYFDFYSYHLQKHPYPIAFGGSIAFLGENLLFQVANSLNIPIQAIVKEPLHKLVHFYLEKNV